MPVLTIYYVEETRRYQCAGAGLIGIGSTQQEALAAWLADWRRTQPR